jgi:hypothetical protein
MYQHPRSRTAPVLPAVLAALLLLLSAGVTVDAQSNGYDLSWWTVDGGGQIIQGGGLTLMGTAGQPDTGPTLSGGGYTLIGGFWPAGRTVQYRVYLPLVTRAVQ